MFDKLTEADKLIANIYSIEDNYIKWAREIKPELPDFISEKLSSKEADAPEELYCLAERLDFDKLKLIKYCKFYMALMAYEILKETPVNKICEAFKCNKG